MTNKNLKINNIILRFALSFCILFLTFYVFNISLAAEIYFDAGIEEKTIGEKFKTDLILNTLGEFINAIEGKIVFSGDDMELAEIKEANSIVNFWLEKPAKKQETNKGNQEVIFSGIIPGGYLGEKGLLFSLVFLPKKEGDSIIEISETKALLNDGKGTSVSLKTPIFQFAVSKQGQNKNEIKFSEIKDTNPPESFKPEIGSDSSIFDGKYFLVFVAQDKEAGVKHYQIKETKQRFFTFFSKWIEAESPYVLLDQKLESWIFIKAGDKAGNERITKIAPQKPSGWYKNYENLIILIIIIVIIFIYWIVRIKIKNKIRK